MDANKKIKISLGYIVSFIVIGIAAFGWLPFYSFEQKNNVEIIAIAVAKTAAFGGLAMFAWSLILSARFTFFDKLFNGLDKMYTAHRFFGSLSVVLLLLHPIGLTMSAIPSQGLQALSIWVAFQSTALVLGMISLYGLIGIGVWSISTRVRHEVFIQIHRLLGFLFIAGALHAFMAGSVLAAGQFMFWYILLLTLLATASFLYHSIFSDFLQKPYMYEVESIHMLPGSMYDVRLKPKYRIIKYLPGQFMYVSFDRLGVHGYHPFTIASGTRTSQLQFLVKASGDFTTSFHQLKKGDVAKLKGPYGGFTMEDKRFDKHLWIAGGVGITPFLSKARSLRYNKKWPQIDLVYATKFKADAAALKELQELQNIACSFHVTHLRENTHGIVSLHDIHEHFGDLHEYAIFICGPPGMLKSYIAQAEHLGIQNNIHYEEFSY